MLPSLESCERYLKERFGAEKVLEKYRFVERSGDFWIIPRKMELKEKYMTAGIRAFRDTGIGIKPTTYFLQFLGETIEKNIVDLSINDLERLVFKREKIDTGKKSGYIALKFRDNIIGCGLVKRGKLETQIPKGRAKTLEQNLKDE